MPDGARIAFIRLRSLGDAVCSTPALQALRAWRPDLRLGYVIEDRFAAALEGQAELFILRTPAGSAAAAAVRGELAPAHIIRAQAFWPLARRLRAWRPDLTINLHGGSRATALLLASGARWRAGFAGGANPWALNLRTPPAPPPPGRRRLHCAEHVASLLFALGLPPAPLGPARLAPQPEALSTVRSRLEQAGITAPYVFVHAGARDPSLIWPPERMAAWLNLLCAEQGWTAVMAREPGAHRRAEEAVLAGMQPGVRAVCLRDTSAAELIALIAGAAWVVGNDGGPLHVGAALAKPVIAFFAGTDPDVWYPWRVPHRLLRAGGGCATCPSAGCLRQGAAPCIRAIPLAAALHAARELASEVKPAH